MLEREVKLTAVAGLCGILLAITGFVLWYNKLQLPQDIIVSKKAKNDQQQ